MKNKHSLEIYTFRNFPSTFSPSIFGRAKFTSLVCRVCRSLLSAATPCRDRFFRFEITNESREHRCRKKCNSGGRAVIRVCDENEKFTIFRTYFEYIAYPLISLEFFIDPFFFFFLEFTIKHTFWKFDIATL